MELLEVGNLKSFLYMTWIKHCFDSLSLAFATMSQCPCQHMSPATCMENTEALLYSRKNFTAFLTVSSFKQSMTTATLATSMYQNSPNVSSIYIKVYSILLTLTHRNRRFLAFPIVQVSNW